MLIKRPDDMTDNDVTDFETYQRRRDFLKTLGGIALLGASGLPLMAQAKSTFSTDEEQTPYKDVTTYNNFYEFGTDKSDPAEYAGSLQTSPWSITVDGECENPGKLTLEDLLKPHSTEERIYRLRCVEGWSMVIPWMGFPLADLLKRFNPTSKAKYVRFETLFDPKQMPGQQRSVLDWPYAEGLRMDEAMHPLTFMATGLYGKNLPNQNGAPLRLVVPWKYGFKGAKSIVKIRFTEKMPRTSWMKAGPREYGFYANVNPNVDHPRWTQSSEKRIGAGLFAGRIKTQMFNGYAEQVGQMYAGLDLQKNF